MIDAHHAFNVRTLPLEPPARVLDRSDVHTTVLDNDRLIDTKLLNETFLYHGTTEEVADVIAHHGFDERVASLAGMYGAGVYFADQACKSAQYCSEDHSGLKTLIVARVTLGDPYYASSGLSSIRRPPSRNKHFAQGLTYDSVIANSSSSQAHREYIIYDHRQAYPEYIVHFRE